MKRRITIIVVVLTALTMVFLVRHRRAITNSRETTIATEDKASAEEQTYRILHMAEVAERKLADSIV